MKTILFEDALILSAVRASAAIVRLLPQGAAIALGRLIGLAFYATSKRRTIAYRNLRAAFPERSAADLGRIGRASFESMAVSIVEMLRFPLLDEAWMQKNVTIVGEEKFRAALARGKGIIFLSAHFGNWELLSIVSGLRRYPLVVLAREQKHPRSDAYLNSLRASKGAQVIFKGMPVREILKALHAGKIVGVVGDQDGGKKGTFVSLFGRLSSTPSGTVRFAARTGAAVIPIFPFREPGGRHRIEILDEIPLPQARTEDEAERDVLQRYSAALESAVRREPGQWLWAHRRWKSSPDRFVLVLSDGKRGHLNQSLALAEAVREDRAAKGAPADALRTTIVDVKYRSEGAARLARILVAVTRGWIPMRRRVIGSLLHPECRRILETTYADAVISAGTSAVAGNLFVKDLNRCRSAVLMKPPASSRHFDAVVVPRHDRMKPGKGVFVTEQAPSLLTPSALDREARALEREFPSSARVKVGLLVGGDTAAMPFDRARFEGALGGLVRYAEAEDAAVFATSSRRTPRWADALLKERLGSTRRCPLLVIANEANRDGVVSGILGLCDVAVVTGESVSMVSEAVSAGKPVAVFMPSEGARMKRKYREFLDRLASSGVIFPAEPGDLEGALRRACSSGGSSARFLESDRAALAAAARRIA